MKILVINCGSSSLKYQLMDTSTKVALAKGLVDRIGLSGAIMKHQKSDGTSVNFSNDIPNHNVAVESVLSILIDEKHGVIKDINEIEAVGHRVVHGGESFASSVLITDNVMKELEANIELAPLHNPSNIVGIVACQKHLPHIMQIGVFDTAFHQQMPAYAYLYGIPLELYRKYKIRRYGFHGTSHYFVANRAAEILNKPIKDLKIITCHLGNGCSMAAVKGGISVDTSMGFTPLDGLLMGTRSGDMDPQIILYIMGKEGMSKSEAETLLNKRSGLAGLSETSSDMREIESAMHAGDQKCKTAFDIFCYRVKKYIGSYAATMGGVDAVVFTGGIGENSTFVRDAVCEGMEFLGITLDDSKNTSKDKEKDISVDGSRIRVLVVPTNEELVIAMDTDRIVNELKKKN